LERDPDFVVVEPLAEAIASFLENWNLNHPQIAGQWGLDPDAPIPLRGTEWLAIEADLDEDLVRAIRRRTVNSIELGVFDRLITAMDCPELIHDRRVTIIHLSPAQLDKLERERAEEDRRRQDEERRKADGRRAFASACQTRHLAIAS
jgi:hypothetical protein